MRAILEFDLEPGNDDVAAHVMAVHAGDLYNALSDIAEQIRKELKYCEPSKATREALEKIGALIPRDVMNLIG